MAYPTYAQPPARTRPAVITVSSYLLYVTAAAGLIAAAISLSQVSTMSNVYQQAYAGTPAAGSEAIVVAGVAVAAAVNVLFAAGLAMLAIFNNRGKQGARITTWVIGGLSVCCSGFGVAGTALNNTMNLDSAGGPSASEVQRQLSEALPSWYTPVSVTLSVISLLSILGAIILLALPASNAYFRGAQPAWDPSMPYPQPYGGQPPYPPYPGQGAPGYPGQQQYPSQQYPGQPYPGQPYPGQPYPGQPYPGQPYPGQPYPGQPYPGPPAPGQPGAVPGQPGYPPPGSPTPGQPGSAPPGPPAGPGSPQTGSMPPSDPWSRPAEDGGRDQPPTD